MKKLTTKERADLATEWLRTAIEGWHYDVLDDPKKLSRLRVTVRALNKELGLDINTRKPRLITLIDSRGRPTRAMTRLFGKGNQHTRRPSGYRAKEGKP